MPSVQCPRCGVYHPGSAQRCDCGYDFASGEVKASNLLTEADRQSSKLKRRSISRMLLLTVVTGGFYYPFWFLLRQHDINSLNAKEKLQSFPFVVAIVLVAFSVGFGVGASNVEAAAEMYEGAARLADFGRLHLAVGPKLQGATYLRSSFTRGPGAIVGHTTPKTLPVVPIRRGRILSPDFLSAVRHQQTPRSCSLGAAGTGRGRWDKPLRRVADFRPGLARSRGRLAKTGQTSVCRSQRGW